VSPHLVVSGDPDLHARLDGLARISRMLFVAGLPGTGKSLLVHQIAHLAAGAGRVVHVLQWDVVPCSKTARRGGAIPWWTG
jgi:MoxR-like ATPase